MTMSYPSLEDKIGQLFLVGFSGDTLSSDHPIVEDITEGNLGGVILFDQLLAMRRGTNNIISSKQLRELTTSLQDAAKDPLLIAVDQEGGYVNRFKENRGFPTTLSAEVLGKNDDLQLTIDSARQTAEMLRSTGINFNLSPVVDLNLLTENPIIGKYGRSFSEYPEGVIDHAGKWISEHKKVGILNCLKHFPGHGSSRTDSHLGFVDITQSWQKEELIPFERLISSGLADAIMTGHLYNKNFDSHYPATLSSSTLQSLLRKELQFDGVIISDDMQMKAITSRFGLEEACCKAIKAGIDLIIIGNNLVHDPFVFRKLAKSLRNAVLQGTLTEERIEDAWTRVQKIKQLPGKTI